MLKKDLKIGFIGCGKMASAIISGVIKSNFINKENIMASEISEEIAEKSAERTGIKVFTDNKFVTENSDIIFIATKPHFVETVINDIKEKLSSEKLLVSIAAGVTTKKIEKFLDKKVPLIRVMPNTPALVLEGMSGVCKGTFANDEQLDFIKELLETIGKCVKVDEDKFDIVTAISGSGPAFFYLVIEEIARAGEKLGLDYETALKLSYQTAIGSAKMIET